MLNKYIGYVYVLCNLFNFLSVFNLCRLFFKTKNTLNADDAEETIMSISEMIATLSEINHAVVVFLGILFSILIIVCNTIYFVIKNSTTIVDIVYFVVSILTPLLQINVLAITIYENNEYHYYISLAYFIFMMTYIVGTFIDTQYQHSKNKSKSIFKDSLPIVVLLWVTGIICVLYVLTFILYIVKNPTRLTFDTISHGVYFPHFELYSIILGGCCAFFNNIKGLFYKNIQIIHS